MASPPRLPSSRTLVSTPIATKCSKSTNRIDTPTTRKRMAQRTAAMGIDTRRIARHDMTAEGVSSNSARRSICPQNTSAASKAIPRAVLARPVHQRRRVEPREWVSARACSFDSIRAGSYQIAADVGQSLDTVVYTKQSYRINGTPDAYDSGHLRRRIHRRQLGQLPQ